MWLGSRLWRDLWSLVWQGTELFGLGLGRFAPWVFGQMTGLKGVRVGKDGMTLTQFAGPAPSYKNVIPSGPGWYRFSLGKWRQIDTRQCEDCAGMPGLHPEPVEGRWLDEGDLLTFALDAVVALRGKVK